MTRKVKKESKYFAVMWRNALNLTGSWSYINPKKIYTYKEAVALAKQTANSGKQVRIVKYVTLKTEVLSLNHVPKKVVDRHKKYITKTIPMTDIEF